MPQRDPRSPEPRGSHAFAGGVPSNRLNPADYKHPDPFSLTQLTVTTLVVDSIYAPGTGNITLFDNIELGAAGVFIGTSGTPLGILHANTIYAGSGQNLQIGDNLEPIGSITVGLSGDKFANGYFTDFNVSGTLDVGTLDVEVLDNTTSVEIDISADLMPEIGSTYDLGSSSASQRWNQMFINDVTLDELKGHSGARILVTEALETVNVRPTGSSGAYDLGNSSSYYGEGHIEDVYTNNLHARSGAIQVNSDLDMFGAEIDFGSTSGTATAGGITPPNITGYINVKVNGTSRKIAYYAD
jgi:hypothetical protein